jgi:dTDP-4-amino-4,6-dideoxygalactose transaminase
MLRQYGWRDRYVSSSFGLNSRLDELQAAILLVKLRHLDEDNKQRRLWARCYDEHLRQTQVILPAEMPYGRHTYHLYVLRSQNRDALREFLAARGIGTGIHYPLPIHLQPAHRQLGYQSGSLPVTEQLAHEILSLPMFPELGEEKASYVAESIGDFHLQAN